MVEVQFSNSLCRMAVRAFAVKLFSDECHRTSVMRSQPWPWGNGFILPGTMPLFTQIYATVIHHSLHVKVVIRCFCNWPASAPFACSVAVSVKAVSDRFTLLKAQRQPGLFCSGDVPRKFRGLHYRRWSKYAKNIIYPDVRLQHFVFLNKP